MEPTLAVLRKMDYHECALSVVQQVKEVTNVQVKYVVTTAEKLMKLIHSSGISAKLNKVLLIRNK